MEEDSQLADLRGALAREQDAEMEEAWPSEDGALRPIGGADFEALLGAALPAAAPGEGPAPVAPPPPHGGGGRGGLGLGWAALAIAASLAFIALWPAARLPHYALEVGSGDRTWRGDTVGTQSYGTHSYAEGSRFLLTARPATDIEGVDARLLRREGAALRPLPTTVEISGAGAVHVDAVVGETLPLSPGAHILVIEIKLGSETRHYETRLHVAP